MSTTITQLSQSLSLDGSEKFAIDNSFGTFNTTLNSMSVYIENLVATYPFTNTVESSDRIKIAKTDGVYSFNPGNSIFRDVSSGSIAASNQIVMGSDERLSDSRHPLFHSHSINDTYLLQSELDKRIRTSSIAVAYGVASLDGNGKVPIIQIPDQLSGQVVYMGVWNATSNTPLLINSNISGTKGNYYEVSTGGSVDFGNGVVTFNVGDWVLSNGIEWTKVDLSTSIKSVAGKSGSIVVLYASDIINALSKTGSTMDVGAYLNVNTPISSNHTANKGYVDSTFVPLSGGTMTGPLTISGSNNIRFGAADRQAYYDGGSSLRFTKSGNTNLRVDDNGDAQIRSNLYVGGDITAFYTSDERLKENIKTINDPLEKISKIKGVQFDWNDVSEKTGSEYGVIAQDVESVLPLAVKTRDNGYKSVNYQEIIPLLIESIKSLKSEIETLKSNR